MVVCNFQNGDTLFTNVVLVKSENRSNCRFLPPLGQLPSLKMLYLRRMSGVESVGLEFYGEGSLSFLQLETLEFEDMQLWREWYPCEGDQGIRVFPYLKTLSINRCPKLEGKLPENLDSLTNLMVHDFDQLPTISIFVYSMSIIAKRWCIKVRLTSSYWSLSVFQNLQS